MSRSLASTAFVHHLHGRDGGMPAAVTSAANKLAHRAAAAATALTVTSTIRNPGGTARKKIPLLTLEARSGMIPMFRDR